MRCILTCKQMLEPSRNRKKISKIIQNQLSYSFNQSINRDLQLLLILEFEQHKIKVRRLMQGLWKYSMFLELLKEREIRYFETPVMTIRSIARNKIPYWLFFFPSFVWFMSFPATTSCSHEIIPAFLPYISRAYWNQKVSSRPTHDVMFCHQHVPLVILFT